MKIRIISLAARFADTETGQMIVDWQVLFFVDMCDGSKADTHFTYFETLLPMDELIEEIKKYVLLLHAKTQL